jgi:hypothetical protein
MKRILLFIAAGLMMTITAQANEISLKQTNDFDNNPRYRTIQPVLFTYNQVDYALFPNGEIEFELAMRRSRSTLNRRSSIRSQNTYNTSNRSSFDRRFVRYNRRGQVTKIGSTRVFYNSLGQVAKVGNLNVHYRNRVLNSVGGLQVLYNRRGEITAARGHVLVRNHYDQGHDCNDHNFGHFDTDDQDDHQDWDNGIYFKRKSAQK